jgi:hypothetical protein
MTPEEAKELHAEMMKTFERLVGTQRLFAERRDPKLRPPGSVPVEFVLLGYPGPADVPPRERAAASPPAGRGVPHELIYVVLTEAGERCHAEAVPTHRDVLARLLPASMLSAASSGG